MLAHRGAGRGGDGGGQGRGATPAQSAWSHTPGFSVAPQAPAMDVPQSVSYRPAECRVLRIHCTYPWRGGSLSRPQIFLAVNGTNWSFPKGTVRELKLCQARSRCLANAIFLMLLQVLPLAFSLKAPEVTVGIICVEMVGEGVSRAVPGQKGPLGTGPGLGSQGGAAHICIPLG